MTAGVIKLPTSGMRVATSQYKMPPAMKISRQGSTGVICQYSPRETTYSNIAYTWDEITRAGMNSVLVNSVRPAPHIAFTLTLSQTTRDAKSPWSTKTGTTVEQDLKTLRAYARSQTAVKISYTSWESLLAPSWRIVAMTVNVIYRDSVSNAITQCTVDIEFAAILTNQATGPVKGGSKKSSTTQTSDPTTPAKVSKQTKYTVKSGDTLSKISNKFYGDPNDWTKITKANPSIKNPNLLKVGQVLVIPSGG